MSPQQVSLFPELSPVPTIPGLTYLPEYIIAEEAAILLSHLDANPWLTDLKRRVQHYGYRYDYKARNVSPEMKLGPLPDWLQDYAERLTTKGLFSEVPDQVIINEYLPGQGISAHIDCVPCFSETIASLSLGSPCVMEFTKEEEKVAMLFEPCSLLILTGDARYHWQHSIPARKTDRHNGMVFLRDRRVSLTFRKVIAV